MTWLSFGWFLAGLFVGAFAGSLVMALCAAAGRGTYDRR